MKKLLKTQKEDPIAVAGAQSAYHPSHQGDYSGYQPGMIPVSGEDGGHPGYIREWTVPINHSQMEEQQRQQYDPQADYPTSNPIPSNVSELDDTGLAELATGDQRAILAVDSNGTIIQQMHRGNAMDEFVDSLRDPLVWIRRLCPSWRFGKDLGQGPCYQHDVRKAVIQLANAYKDICIELSSPAHKILSELKHWKKEHDKIQRKLEKAEDDYENNVKGIRTEHAKSTGWMNSQIETLKKEKRDRDFEQQKALSKLDTDRRRQYVELQTKTNRDITQLQSQVAKLEDDKLRLERSAQQELNSFQRRKQKAVEVEQHRLMDKYGPKIEALEIELAGKNEEMESKVADAILEYQTEIATLKIDHANDIRTLSSQLQDEGIKHDEEIRQIEGEMDDLKIQHASELSTLENRHAIAFKDLEDEHHIAIQEKDRRFNSEIAKKEKEKQHAVKRVAQENQTLKGALISKGKKEDKQGAMTDHQISTLFQDLGGEIDDLARTAKWDQSRGNKWPIPDYVMKKTENERRTKQYVLQNTIWAVLDEKIFRTPFRVLGRRGRSNDQKWFSEYGGGKLCNLIYVGSADSRIGDDGNEAQWPYPSEESEKWRRDRIKEFYEVMDKQIAPGNPKFTMKEEFDATILATREELMIEMRKISKETHIEVDRLEKIARAAAKLWIQCGMQWARIHVKMSSSGQLPLRSGAGHTSGPQELIIKPELRRSGNAEARFYDQEEVIADGAGKFSMI